MISWAFLVQPVGQLEPLALPARERRERLAEREVPEPDVDDRGEPLGDLAPRVDARSACAARGEERTRST
jgi:hypothetical protein